jgi:hypothetical protein
MTEANRDAHFLPSLFTHSMRKEWGVGVLAWEADGKRGYLFEDGEERTLASGFHQLMHRVERLDRDQQAAYARLRGVLAKRAVEAKAAGNMTGGPSFADQLARLHETFPAGVLDPKWASDVRGEGAETKSSRRREAMIRDAQERLSVATLDALISSQKFGPLWDLVISVLSQTDLVPVAQLKALKVAEAEQKRALAAAVRDLLYGAHPYEQRFDRYVSALSTAFGKPPRWEMATALSALVHPTQHVCVEPTAFRKQLKACNSRAPVASQPSSAGYTRFLNVARLVANKLAEQGEVPRDLLDVFDFISITLKPASKARVARVKASPVKEVEVESDDSEAEEAEED